MLIESTLLLSLLSQCQSSVDASVLSRLIEIESGSNPYAIEIEGMSSASQPSNKNEAISISKDLTDKNIPFRAGLFQLRSSEFSSLGITEESVFEPCNSISVAASKFSSCQIMVEKEEGNISDRVHKSVSCFRYGNFNEGFERKGMKQSYVEKFTHAQIESKAKINSGKISDLPKIKPNPAAAWDVFSELSIN
ncbi:transglycosylase SLT domain-containing protein [Enterovibrio calviensis]|uniref:transglycosylase SLT domain-containing protein n=1 Tax=Enterovibrio calviensis TaxID=91359 RepID=UPI0037360047